MISILVAKRMPFWLVWPVFCVSVVGWLLGLVGSGSVSAADTGQTSVPTALGSGSFYTCALKSDGAISCWGNNDDEQAAPLPGPFKQVEAGYDHTCAIRTDATVACWGANASGQASPPSGTFTQVSAGVEYSCGIKSDSSLACWGNNDDSQLAVPAGSFTQVSAGSYHACGIKSNGALACWGNNDENQAAPPAGSFKQVSAGDFHTCAVKSDNTLVCWGNNDDVQSSPTPSGAFQQVSAGASHSCALKNDGALVCWGANSSGQTAAPVGSFLQVSVGDDHGCGLRSDSLISCWGENADGQAPVLQVQPTTLPAGTVGLAYSQTISATAQEYTVLTPTVNIAASALPPGLSLNSASGLLQGNPTLSGQFTFAVQVVDANGLDGQRQYTLKINTAPSANHQSVATGQETAKVVMLSAADANGDALTYAVVSPPSHGVLSGAPPALTYTPAAGFSGSDSFTFKANDGLVDSNLATVTITVTPNPPPNTPPQANDQTNATARNSVLALTLNGSDAEGNPLTFTVVSQPAQGVLSGTPPQLLYTPNADFTGTDSFTFKANDGQVDSNLATVTLQVLANNTPPVAHSQDLLTLRNQPLTITLTAADDDRDPLTYALVDLPSRGVLSGTPPQVIYTPNANVLGVDHFTFKVNDGRLDSPTATITITVRLPFPLNVKPVANDQRLSTTRNSPKAITLSATDGNGDNLTYQLLSQPTHGALSGPPPNVVYTPAPVFSGSDSFTFNANDGQVDSERATVTITVITANSPPVANPQTVTVNKNTAKTLTLTASDSDGDTLTYTVLSQPAHGSLSDTPPNLVYRPAADFTGADNFTFQVNDGQASSSPVTVTLNVIADQPANLPPVVNDQTINTRQATVTNITLIAADPNGDPLTYIIVSTPAHGTLSGSAPALIYTPAGDFSGADSFTFKVNDGLSDSNTATVRINIAGVTPQVAVAGIIYHDKNGNRQKESDELGIPGAKVILSGPVVDLTGSSSQSAKAERTIFTNADGIYRFDQVAAGAYTLRVEPPAGYLLAGDSQVTITVGETGTVTLPPFSFRQLTNLFLPLLHR